MVRVSCDQCSQSFNTKKLFVSHLISKSCHKSIREAAKSQTRNKGQHEEAFDYPTLEIVPFQDCSECRWFSKPGMQMYMLSHLASHVNSKSDFFQCDDCFLKFESAYYLEKHENKKHKKEKCKECPKKFKITSLLQKHVEDVHKTWECRDCDMKFITEECLEKHVYNTHPTDICEDCGMAFENMLAVEKHYKDIHEKIKCDDCDKEFDTMETLDNHKVEKHNVAKTTFKQFGGGLMMMMISEEQVPEESVGDKVEDLTKAIVAREAQAIVQDIKHTQVIENQNVPSTDKDAEVEDRSEDANPKVNVESEVENDNVVSPKKDTDPIGSGFFMICEEEADKEGGDQSCRKVPLQFLVSKEECNTEVNQEAKCEMETSEEEKDLTKCKEAGHDLVVALNETKKIDIVDDDQVSNSDLMDTSE